METSYHSNRIQKKKLKVKVKMKAKIKSLFKIILLYPFIVFPLSVFGAGEPKENQCRQLVETEIGIDKGQHDFLLELLGIFFVKNRRLPQMSELISGIQRKGKPFLSEAVEAVEAKESTNSSSVLHEIVKKRSLNPYFDASKDLSSFSSKNPKEKMRYLMGLAVKEQSDLFANIRMSIQKQVLSFLKKRMRPPQLSELAFSLKMLKVDLAVLIRDTSSFLEEALSTKEGQDALLVIHNKIVSAFLSFVRQQHLPKVERTMGRAPASKELFQVFVNKDIKLYQDKFFTEAYFNYLTGAGDKPKLPSALDFKMKPFFSGMKEIESVARKKSPNAFNNFRDTEVYSLEYSKKIAQEIVKKGGFLVTSINGGVPYNKGMFKSMLKVAEEKDLPILIGPTNLESQGIPQEILDHPRVYTVMNSLELSDFLRVWAIPIMAKNQNPFASLDKHGQGFRRQSQIVFHPQLAYKVVPTAENDLHPHGLWSTGSLSENLYPYTTTISGRTSMLAKGYHQNAFLIVEATDGEAGPVGKGAPGRFHVRSMEYFDFRDEGGESGVLDLGQFYTSSGKKRTLEPQALVFGDLHDFYASQEMLKVYKEILETFPKLDYLIIHDPLDGNSHNHHQSKEFSLLMEKFKRGELDIKKEVEGLIQTVNAFLKIHKNLKVIFPDSNHSYWIDRLVDDPKALSDPINGPFFK